MAKGNPLSGSSPPWQQMVNDPSAFFGVDQLPDGFELKDPSKMTKDPLILLLTTWVAKQKEGQVVFRFHHTIDSEGNMVEADCPPETNVKSKRTRKKKVVEDLAAEGDDESDTGAEGSMRRRTRTDRKTSVRIRPGAADEIDKGAVAEEQLPRGGEAEDRGSRKGKGKAVPIEESAGPAAKRRAATTGRKKVAAGTVGKYTMMDRRGKGKAVKTEDESDVMEPEPTAAKGVRKGKGKRDRELDWDTLIEMPELDEQKPMVGIDSAFQASARGQAVPLPPKLLTPKTEFWATGPGQVVPEEYSAVPAEDKETAMVELYLARAAAMVERNGDGMGSLGTTTAAEAQPKDDESAGQGGKQKRGWPKKSMTEDKEAERKKQKRDETKPLAKERGPPTDTSRMAARPRPKPRPTGKRKTQ